MAIFGDLAKAIERKKNIYMDSINILISCVQKRLEKKGQTLEKKENLKMLGKCLFLDILDRPKCGITAKHGQFW